MTERDTPPKPRPITTRDGSRAEVVAYGVIAVLLPAAYMEVD